MDLNSTTQVGAAVPQVKQSRVFVPARHATAAAEQRKRTGLLFVSRHTQHIVSERMQSHAPPHGSLPSLCV